MEHDVRTVMNAGGYMSIVVRDVVYEKGEVEETTKYFNYDLNKKSMIKLNDIFTGDFDYKTAIAAIVNDPDNYYNPDHLANISKDGISEEDFCFDENGVEIHMNPQQNDNSYRSFWIPYREIGWKNLALY